MLMLMNAWMMLVLMKYKCQMKCLTVGCYKMCDQRACNVSEPVLKTPAAAPASCEHQPWGRALA